MTVRRLLLGVVAAAILAPTPAAAAEPRHPNYMAFGDSISTRFQTPNGTITPYYETVNMRGYGIGKTSAREAASWWPAYVDTLPSPPTTAIFLIGINDLRTGASADTLIDRYRTLVALGADRGIRVVFGTILPTPKGSDWRDTEARRRVVNAWVRGRDFVDYAGAITCHPDQIMCPEYARGTDIHPNGAAHVRMGAVLDGWVRADKER